MHILNLTENKFANFALFYWKHLKRDWWWHLAAEIWHGNVHTLITTNYFAFKKNRQLWKFQCTNGIFSLENGFLFFTNGISSFYVEHFKVNFKKWNHPRMEFSLHKIEHKKFKKRRLNGEKFSSKNRTFNANLCTTEIDSGSVLNIFSSCCFKSWELYSKLPRVV